MKSKVSIACHAFLLRTAAAIARVAAPSVLRPDVGSAAGAGQVETAAVKPRRTLAQRDGAN